jgi:hypothetical protein
VPDEFYGSGLLFHLATAAELYPELAISVREGGTYLFFFGVVSISGPMIQFF